MKIIKTIKEFTRLKAGCCLTIGNFDGVHIGHQKILILAKEAAADAKLPLVVVAFEPHPVSVLHPEKAPERLTPLCLKEHLLESLGAVFLFLLKPDRKLLGLSPDDFVKNIIVKRIRPKIVVEGENFHFAANRVGNIHTLIDLGAENGFEIIVAPSASAKLSTGSFVKISSSLIRNLLIEGNVTDAAIALGRPYRLIGLVSPGKGKGKLLGFPTANLDNISQLIPAEAVYAATASIGSSEDAVIKSGKKIPAAVSIGRAATFGKNTPLLIEAHLLAESVGPLYGKWLALDFIRKIRNQKKFRSENDLADQIEKDCQLIKKILLSTVIVS